MCARIIRILPQYDGSGGKKLTHQRCDMHSYHVHTLTHSLTLTKRKTKTFAPVLHKHILRAHYVLGVWFTLRALCMLLQLCANAIAFSDIVTLLLPPKQTQTRTCYNPVGEIQKSAQLPGSTRMLCSVYTHTATFRRVSNGCRGNEHARARSMPSTVSQSTKPTIASKSNGGPTQTECVSEYGTCTAHAIVCAMARSSMLARARALRQLFPHVAREFVLQHTTTVVHMLLACMHCAPLVVVARCAARTTSAHMKNQFYASAPVAAAAAAAKSTNANHARVWVVTPCRRRRNRRPSPRVHACIYETEAHAERNEYEKIYLRLGERY